jgi:hypothetical protein
MTATAEKLDLYKEHKKEYAATKKPALVDLKQAVYLGIEGRGTPGGKAFSEAVGALYGMAFTIKMTRKFAGKKDYAVCKLEALWPEIAGKNKEQWRWELLIRTPEFIEAGDLEQAAAVLIKRGKGNGVDRVRLRRMEEGACVQALHVGAYDEEPRTIAQMLEFAERQGLEPAGAHHEIYLNDPRRIEPARLKTILRQPVTKKR